MISISFYLVFNGFSLSIYKHICLKQLNRIDFFFNLMEYKIVTGETNLFSAEGATTLETLRQKDRCHNNSGK